MTEFSRLDFIKSQRPIEPLCDWRFRILVVPIAISVIGIAMTSMFSLAFDHTDIVVPPMWQSWFAVLGSVLTVLSSEANSPGTFFEIWRKSFKKDENENITGWDWIALALSVVGSVSTILIMCAVYILKSQTFASVFGDSGLPSWVTLTIAWMPLVASLAIVGDNVGALIEAASLYASYEKRIDVWYEKLEHEQSEMSTSLPVDIQNTIADLQKEIAQLHYPPAELPWFKSQLSKANGNLSKYQSLGAYEAVQNICLAGGKRFDKTERTASTWFELVKGKLNG